MVRDYYKLREEPFGVTPDSRFLYSSPTHREALASLLYGIEARRGFVALIAKPGMGKTTLLFELLNRLRNRASVVFIFQTICTPMNLLRAILVDLGVQIASGNLTELQQKLNDVIRERLLSGRPVIVVIDEAQNLDESVLEAIRMLSNFETPEGKLIQIVLCGQPQLADKLASPSLTQLRQRISIFARLNPFSEEETELYIQHRLRAAGHDSDQPLFTDAAISSITQSSEGIPRNINNLCFNALSLAYASKRKQVDRDILREVVVDLDLGPFRERDLSAPGGPELHAVPTFLTIQDPPSGFTGWIPRAAAGCALLAILSGALYQGYHWLSRGSVVRATSAASLSAPAARSTFSVPALSSHMPAPIQTVKVEQGQSLTRICVDRLGTCSPERIRAFHQDNPWLNNLDHIELGQTIRIPTPEEINEAQAVGEQSRGALRTKEAKQ
jgi:type II secretory pathway predicted ATPase ExeA